MSTIAQFQGAADAVNTIFNNNVVSYTAFTQGLNAIDPSSPTAQSQYDAILAARVEYVTTTNPTLTTALATAGEYRANLGVADVNAGELIQVTIADATTRSVATKDAFIALTAQKQKDITDGLPIPRPNVQPPAGGNTPPSVRRVDDAIASKPATGSPEFGKFITLIKGTGLAFASKYTVSLPPIAGFDMQSINLQCNVSGMPDITISGGDAKIYGESAEIPNGAAYGQLQLSFYITNEFDTLGYFEAWSNLVFDRMNRTIGYYRDYAFPITIQVLDRASNPRYTVFYMDCWPKNINTTNLSYDSHGNMTVNVTMQYKYWMSSITGKISPDKIPVGDGKPYGAAIPLGPLGSVSGVGAAADAASAVGIYNGNGLAALTGMGPRIGSDLLSAANQSAQAVKSLTNMADGTGVGSLMSKYASQLGTSSSVMGSGLGSIASNLTTILAPAGQIARGVAGMSGALSSMDNLLSRMGIKTNIGSTVSNLNGVAGQIAVIGQLNGIPGAMSSLGSSLGSISGDIAAIQRSLVNVPGATKSMTGSFGNLSNVFNQSGNNVSAIGNMRFN